MSDIMIETLLPDFSNLCEIGLCPNRYTYIYGPDIPAQPGPYSYNGRLYLGAESRHVIQISENYWILVCWGTFDKFAVVSCRRCADNICRIALPLDLDYFSILQYLGNAYSSNIVLDHVVSFYNRLPRVRGIFDSSLIDYVFSLAECYYGLDVIAARFAFAHLLYGFMAEDCKTSTWIGRLIKMNAVCDFMTGLTDMQTAIDYTNSKPGWREIRDRAWRNHKLICPWANYMGVDYVDEIPIYTGYRLDTTGFLVLK